MICIKETLDWCYRELRGHINRIAKLRTTKHAINSFLMPVGKLLFNYPANIHSFPTLAGFLVFSPLFFRGIGFASSYFSPFLYLLHIGLFNLNPHPQESVSVLKSEQGCFIGNAG